VVRERGGHRGIHLERDHVGAAVEERPGEAAATGAHLVQQIVGFDLGGLDHRADRAWIGEEVLAERAPGADVLVPGLLRVGEMVWRHDRGSCLPLDGGETRTGVIAARPIRKRTRRALARC
jgi:hypothetical protein